MSTRSTPITPARVSSTQGPPPESDPAPAARTPTPPDAAATSPPSAALETPQGESSSSAPSRRYVLITPCRDEADYLPVTIRTVAAQSVLPARWVIVDDGSSDATPRILAEAAARHEWIRVVRREDRGERKVGPGVIDAFYAGLETIDLADYDYVCKLDGDLELPPRYFERLMEEMEREPRLGTFSGKMYVHQADRLVHEERGDENSCGPSKFYRVECFLDIGGFVREVGWDGIDGHHCRMNGWMACSADREDIRALHLRPIGTSHRGLLHGRMRGGAGNWHIGMSLPYMLARTVYRMKDRPYVINSMAVLIGYLRAMVRREPRHGDAAYRRYLRAYERSALLRGKRRAVRAIHDRLRDTTGTRTP